MLGGMREEKVYKVTLMEEKRSEELTTDTEKKSTAERIADVVEVEEHQVAYNGNLLRHLILALHIPLYNQALRRPVSGTCTFHCSRVQARKPHLGEVFRFPPNQVSPRFSKL